MQKYPAYKDSFQQWLGDIPNHWEILPSKRFHKVEKQLNSKRECVNVLSLTLRGVVNNDPDSPEGLVPSDYGTYQIFEQEDLVFKLIDLENVKTSRVGIVHEKGIMSSAYIRLVIGDGNCSRFAYYYFYCLYLNQVYNNLGSGVRSTLGPTDLLNIPYLKPTLPEQNAIAAFLDRKTALIDQAIDIKKKQIELLKERKQILIHKAVTRGLNPNVKMKDSGVEWIGEIPEGWAVEKNRILFHERNEPGNEKLPLLSISIHTAVSSEELNEEENIRGKIKIEDKSKYKYVEVGDIAFNMMRAWQGAIGSVSTKGMVSPAYVVAKPQRTFDSTFFEYQYRTEIFIQQMDRSSKGITDFRKRLYWNEFKQLMTILPPIKEQKEISIFIKNMSLKIENAISSKEQEIEKLKEYKATLINSAVTGKIKVSNNA